MKNFAKSLVLSLFVFFAAGCVTPYSLQPLYKADEKTFDPQLLGAWGNKDFQGGIFTLEKNPKDENSYIASISDETNFEQFVAHLTKIGEVTLLDFVPLVDESKVHAAFAAMVPAHGFTRIEITPDKITMRMLDEEWFEKVNTPKPLLAYQKVENNLVITATTEELRNFVSNYVLKDDKSLDDPIELFKIKQ